MFDLIFLAWNGELNLSICSDKYKKYTYYTYDVIYSKNGAKICKENPRVFIERKTRRKVFYEIY